MTGDPNASRAAVAAESVSYLAGGQALVDAVTLQVRRGELLVLVGPNGAGKSTLLSLLAGDLQPASGHITLLGRPLHSYRPAELALTRAVLPQTSLLQFAFTVSEVVRLGRYARRRTASQAEDEAAVAAALEVAELTGFTDRRYPTLSGGERARAVLARVLAQDTPILLLDEPTSSLDIRHQQLVLHAARTLAAQGRSVLAVLHDLNLAAGHADRVAVLSEGRLIGCGTAAETLTHDLLGEVFGWPVQVLAHPTSGRPVIVPTVTGT